MKKYILSLLLMHVIHSAEQIANKQVVRKFHFHTFGLTLVDQNGSSSFFQKTTRYRNSFKDTLEANKAVVAQLSILVPAIKKHLDKNQPPPLSFWYRMGDSVIKYGTFLGMMGTFAYSTSLFNKIFGSITIGALGAASFKIFNNFTHDKKAQEGRYKKLLHIFTFTKKNRLITPIEEGFFKKTHKFNPLLKYNCIECTFTEKALSFLSLEQRTTTFRHIGVITGKKFTAPKVEAKR